MVAEVENMLPLPTAVDRTRCDFSPIRRKLCIAFVDPHLRSMRYRPFRHSGAPSRALVAAIWGPPPSDAGARTNHR